MVNSGDHVTHYDVRIQPRKNIVRSIAISGLLGIGCYIVWANIAFIPLKNLDLSGEVDQREPPEPLFFPFPFTDKQVTQLPYAGAEEEWQDFIKFNSDSKLRERVKHDLVMIVKRAAEKNPATKRWADNGETFHVGPTWLIVSFPERPPPEFVRTGLELGGEKGIEIKQRPVDHRTKVLVDRVLMPYPILSASYAFFKAMFQQNVSTVSQYFGYSTRGKNIDAGNPDAEIEKAISKLQARQSAGGNTATSSSNNDASTSPAASESGDTPSPTADGKDLHAQERPTAKENSSDRPMTKENIPYHAALAKGSPSESGPWAAFKETYTRMWKPLRYLPPRGSLAVHGLVRLDSPKGQVFMDVWGWYHPKTDEFHEGSLIMRLRGISPTLQRPRR